MLYHCTQCNIVFFEDETEDQKNEIEPVFCPECKDSWSVDAVEAKVADIISEIKTLSQNIITILDNDFVLKSNVEDYLNTKNKDELDLADHILIKIITLKV